jgi:hypothetical protein
VPDCLSVATTAGNAELKLRTLVIQETPFYPEQQITGASRRATAVFVHNCDGKLQFELDVGQPIIEIEQRRIHLRVACSALENERDVDFPPTRWRRLRVVRDKWRPSSRQMDREQAADADNGAMKFHWARNAKPHATSCTRNYSIW